MFNSLSFIFIFLPISLIIYFGFGTIPYRKIRIAILLVISIIFYMWGELSQPPSSLIGAGYIFLSILINYIVGEGLFHWEDQRLIRRLLFWIGVGINISLVIIARGYLDIWLSWVGNACTYLNYSAWFEPLQNIKSSLSFFAVQPLGISFFTFAAITYLVDIYHQQMKRTDGSRGSFALFMLFFPKVIAGPIMRYKEFHKQVLINNWLIWNPSIHWEDFANGCRRFMLGLSKKVLIADTLASLVDRFFSLPTTDISQPLAWLGVISFAMQIYYDFSGYSDMAIGLGRMFGFHLNENFNAPYMANTITEFWRRWHISLSTWFRNTVFFPLERHNKQMGYQTTNLNILIVFFLTGLWHGNTINFIIWGLFHGTIIALERTLSNKGIRPLWRPLQHCYTIVVLLVSWIFFRAESLDQVVAILRAMIGLSSALFPLPFIKFPPLENATWLAFFASIVLCLPIKKLASQVSTFFKSDIFQRRGFLYSINLTQDIIIISLFCLALIFMSASTHRAYIYMQF